MYRSPLPLSLLLLLLLPPLLLLLVVVLLPFLVLLSALLRGDDVDAEGFAHTQDLLRRKPSVGSDVRQFSKNIAGRAMVCTSVLSVVPREIAFGNCNIGACVCFFCGVFARGARGFGRKGFGRGGGRGSGGAGAHALVFGGGFCPSAPRT